MAGNHWEEAPTWFLGCFLARILIRLWLARVITLALDVTARLRWRARGDRQREGPRLARDSRKHGRRLARRKEGSIGKGDKAETRKERSIVEKGIKGGERGLVESDMKKGRTESRKRERREREEKAERRGKKCVRVFAQHPTSISLLLRPAFSRLCPDGARGGSHLHRDECH